MTACDERTEQPQRRRDDAQGVAISGRGRAMAAGEEVAAPARARPWTGMGHVRQREEERRLAAREQPLRMHERGQEWAISEARKSDAGWRRGISPSKGATMYSNGPSLGEGRALAGLR